MSWKQYDEIRRKLKDGDEAVIETADGNVHVRWCAESQCFESVERSDSYHAPRLYFPFADWMICRIPKRKKAG